MSYRVIEYDVLRKSALNGFWIRVQKKECLGAKQCTLRA